MKIYITRHSKTIWNLELRLQGRQDSPLTDIGIENAYALKKEIENITFDKVYSSPLPRAFDTAKIITDHTIIKDDRLLEMNFGVLEGQKIKEIQGELKNQYNELWHQPTLKSGITGGETIESIDLRAKRFLNDLIHSNDETVLIVTHGFFFNVLLANIYGYSIEAYKEVFIHVVEGCSLTYVTYENGSFTIHYVGKNDYLPNHTVEKFA